MSETMSGKTGADSGAIPYAHDPRLGNAMRSFKWIISGMALTLAACVALAGADTMVIVHPVVEGDQRDPNQKLAPAEFKHVTDALGFRWDPHPNYGGGFNDGQNDCFDGGLILSINGARFQPRDSKMSEDGREYVLTNQVKHLDVTRRIYINTELSAARIVELIHNPTKAEIQAKVQITSDLGTTPAKRLTSDGKPFSAKLGPDHVGVICVSSGGNRPSAAFLVADPGRPEHVPEVKLNNDDVHVTWDLTVAPGQTLGLIHAVAQRAAGSSVEEIFEALYDRGFVDAQLPKEVAEQIVNFRLKSGGDGEPLIDQITLLAERHEVERGESDIVWMDPDTKITGTIECEQVTIETRYGPATVPWEQVAAIVGGEGVEATMSLYLRNGEILRGLVTAEAMSLTSDDDVTLEFSPAAIALLITRRSDLDNQTSPEAHALVTTPHGDRLIVTAESEGGLSGHTLWGEVRTPLAEIGHLRPDAEMGLARRVILSDGSNFWIVPGTQTLVLHTPRFGPVEAPSTHVAAVGRLATMEQLNDEDADSANAIRPVPDLPRCTLRGETLLAGRLDVTQLEIRHDQGVDRIELERIASITRQDESGLPRFSVSLFDGKSIEGQLRRVMLPIRSPRQSWSIPTEHLLKYEAAKASEDAASFPPGADAEPESESASTAPAAPADGSGGSP